MIRITDELVDKVKAEIDIFSVISPRVQLKKKGKNFVGLCPFHTEKSGSFTVNVDQQFFNCFGCGKGGDAITFVQEFYGISFVEAIEQLANQYSIPIPEQTLSTQEVEKKHIHEAIFNVLDSSRLYGIDILGSQYGLTVRQYLARRGIEQKTIDQFSIGLAPMEWSSFFKHLHSKGFSEGSIESSGICAKNEMGEFYDRFRGRLLFPIQNSLGKTIGFGGRLLEKYSKKAKYINSPQTTLYDKSFVLYGLFQARQAIRSKTKAILCEGYMDVLALHQNGFFNAVASCGTALTEEQVDVLSKYTKHIIIAYDGDSAGKTATAKAIEVILPKGLAVSVIQLTNKEDPDSFLKRYGLDAFEKHIETAVGFIEFFRTYWKESGKLETPQDNAIAIRDLITKTISIPDTLSHHFYFKNIASLFSIDISLVEQESLLIQESQKEQEAFRKKYTPTKYTKKERIDYTSDNENPISTKEIIQSNETFLETIDVDEEVAEKQHPHSEEMNLLRIALMSKSSFSLLVNTFRISTENFEHSVCISLFKRIIEIQAVSSDPVTALFEDESVSDEEIFLLKRLKKSLREPSISWEKFDTQVNPENFEQVIPDYLRTIEIRKVFNRMKELEEEILTNDDRVLLEEYKKLDTQRRSLEEQRGK